VPADLKRIAGNYHCWRGDVPGFCRSASTEKIEAHHFVLTPGRYVGANDEPFEEKIAWLVAEFDEQFEEGAKLEPEGGWV
jgi:type I restriction enzyme M protein